MIPVRPDEAALVRSNVQVEGTSSLQYVLQLLHPLLNLCLQLGKLRENLLRRAMRHLLMQDLFVTIEAEVVSLGDNIGLRHAEALCSAWALALLAVTIFPASKNIRQIVFGMLFWTQFDFGQRS